MTSAIIQEPSHYRHLADVVRNNLENQQDWTRLRIHGSTGIDDDDRDAAGHADRGASDVGGGRSRRGSTANGGRAVIGRGYRPRILLSGLPPRRMYIHPDEQIEILRAERALGNGHRIPQPPEFEWVLPMHLAETPSVSQFASIFDSISALPPGASADGATEGAYDGDGAQWEHWRGPKRAKRLLLAVVQDDSSVVYYFMHDGIVKPRQN